MPANVMKIEGNVDGCAPVKTLSSVNFIDVSYSISIDVQGMLIFAQRTVCLMDDMVGTKCYDSQVCRKTCLQSRVRGCGIDRVRARTPEYKKNLKDLWNVGDDVSRSELLDEVLVSDGSVMDDA